MVVGPLPKSQVIDTLPGRFVVVVSVMSAVWPATLPE
jgi:hypothetical protein